ncbi:MAG: DUF4197 domain-containing protein [Sphingobacteriales bacterium]|nr:MAG: DUF4197 domain-containing protein [Sphingobacteriales bacterium]
MMQKRILFSAALLASLTLPAAAQSGSGTQRSNSLGDVLNTIGSILNGSRDSGNSRTGTSGSTGTYGYGSNSSLGSLSQTDIAKGLREALTIGAENASNRLSATNGFFGDALVKILLPPEAQKVERTLRSVGMGSLVDKAVLSMNRAAEDASKKAVPIFVNAITSISLQDGINILRGGRDAATQYLKSRTTVALTDAFRPVINNSLNKVNATALWSTVFNTYNRLPTSRSQINPDLTAYVTERALNGMFLKIADEEAKIRTNPAARVTSILQEVFGAVQGR